MKDEGKKRRKAIIILSSSSSRSKMENDVFDTNDTGMFRERQAQCHDR